MERWHHIPGYETIYDVSSHGRVKSLARIVPRAGRDMKVAQRTLVPIPDKDGYLVVSLSVGGKVKKAKIHRLVAAAFVPGSGPEVNHLDLDKANNHWRNLAWTTPLGNTTHAKLAGCMRGRPSAMTPDVVSTARDMRATGLSFLSIAKVLGVWEMTVHRVCRA